MSEVDLMLDGLSSIRMFSHLMSSGCNFTLGLSSRNVNLTTPPSNTEANNGERILSFSNMFYRIVLNC
jgi:hypothetical protein